MNDVSHQFPLSPGTYDLPSEVYHADQMCAVPTLSSSLARLMLTRSPRHAWHASPRLNPDHQSDDRKTFDIGRAAHRAVLGKGEAYVAIPDELLSDDGGIRSKDAKAWVADARAQGLTPLKAAEVDAIGVMADAIRERLTARGITIDPARSELTALAEVDGVMCRAMLDHVPADPRLPIIDIKTTTSAAPDGLARTVASWGYEVQAAHYQEVWKAATGEDRKMLFVFVEKEAPHEVVCAHLLDSPGNDADWMADARGKAAEARRMWAECLRDNDWPGYGRGTARIGAPVWHRKEWADREIGQPVTRTAIEAARAAMQPL